MNIKATFGFCVLGLRLTTMWRNTNIGKNQVSHFIFAPFFLRNDYVPVPQLGSKTSAGKWCTCNGSLLKSFHSIHLSCRKFSLEKVEKWISLYSNLNDVAHYQPTDGDLLHLACQTKGLPLMPLSLVPSLGRHQNSE